MSGLSTPFRQKLSERRICTRPEPMESMTPMPGSKPKLFERIKALLSPKKPLTPSPVNTPEISGSTSVEPEGTPTRLYPPPLIVVDPPDHQVHADTSARDVSQNQPTPFDLATVDAERNAASAAVDKMDDNPLSSFLKSLERFTSVVGGIAGIHPYAKAAWSILSFVAKTIIDQKNLDAAVCSLLSKMNDVYVSLIEAELQDIQSMKGVVERISQQTLECSYFIQEYTQNGQFRTRLVKNLVSGMDERVQTYNDVFDELRQQYLNRAAGDTLVVVHRIWKGVEDLVQDVDLKSMPYVTGAGLNTQKTCLEGTRREILDEITAWINRTEDKTPRVFWLHGNAGTGKSFISHTIADRFKKIGRLGSCFCFDRNEIGQQRDRKIFSTIAQDLADRDEHMRKALMDAIRRDTSLKNTTDILQQWKEMILKPAQRLSEGMAGPIVIVIDALDESGPDESRNYLLRILAGKVNDQESHIAKLPSHIRILVTSRPLPDIHEILNSVENVQQKSMGSIPREWSERDILHFISRELLDVGDMNDEDASALMSASCGLFEWARLACAFIKSVNVAGATARERFKIVITSNKDGRVGLLDNIYKLTLRALFPEDTIIPRSTCLARFQSVMAQIIGTTEPLPLASLRSMRSYFANKDLQEINVDVIIKPLGALLSGTTDSGPIRPLHASFPEFLLNQNRSGEFFTDLSGIHDELAFACLGVMKAELRFNICNLTSSYLPNSEVHDLAERLQANITPQLSYSCRFWADHLRHTSAFTSPLANEIRDFLNNNRLLFWIEVLSLEKKISISTSLLSFVIEWSTPGGKDICDDAADTQRFIRTFGGAISLSTPHLYVSAVPFSPRKSSISRKFGKRFGKVVKISDGWKEAWPVIQGVLHGHSARVLCVAFSHDGNCIVSGSDDKTIRLWDAETGERLRPPLEGHEGWVYSVAFSPDGKRIVSGSDDKTIRLWSAGTGELLRPALKGHQDCVFSVAFSPNGKRILSGSGDKTMRLWDAKTGEQLGRPLKGHTDSVLSVAFSSDGKRIVSGSNDGVIQVRDAETGEQLGRLLEGHTNSVLAVAFSPEGKRIVSGSYDKTIRLWNAETGEQLRLPFEGHMDSILSIALSPDGKRIVSGSVDKTIRLWDAETGEQLRPPLEGHDDEVCSVMFSSDGKRIVSGSEDKTIRLWDADTGERLRMPLEGHQHWVRSVAFSSDGKHIVSGSMDKTVRLWDAETGQLLLQPLEGHEKAVFSVAFSSDGRRIVSGSCKTIRLWDAETGDQLQAPFEGHQSWVRSVMFSPDGECIVSGSQDMTIRLWDAETGEQLLQPLEGHEEGVFSVAFSPDGKRIVSGSEDKTIRLWDAGTGQQLKAPLGRHRHWVLSVAFSPNGKRIVSGSEDKMIRLWDAETGEPLQTLEGHQEWVRSVAFSPDGRWIVSGSGDKTIRLWDADTGQQLLQPLEGHEEGLLSVAFSPDGKRIVSASQDKTIRFWNVDMDFQLKQLQPLIRFSSQLADGLFGPLELIDQTSSSSSSQIGLVDMPSSVWNLIDPKSTDLSWSPPTSSGWIRIGPKSSLLFWSPPTYHPRWFTSRTQMIIPPPDVQLDLSNMAHGSSWHLCYNPR